MESFYGGKRGASFVLAKTYSDIQDMIEDFGQGESFDEVKFGEYVLIDNESDETNHGSLYQRGHDSENDYGGAVYIGKITGPKGDTGDDGKSPSLEIVHYSSLASEPPQELTIVGADLVSGATTNVIKYKTSSSVVSGANKLQIGFQFPYPVVNLTGPGVTQVSSGPFYYEYNISGGGSGNASILVRPGNQITSADKQSLPNGGMIFVLEDA